jgi:hypothetical protein
MEGGGRSVQNCCVELLHPPPRRYHDQPTHIQRPTPHSHATVLGVAGAKPGFRPRGEAMGAAARVGPLSCNPVVADCLGAVHQPSQPTPVRRVRTNEAGEPSSTTRNRHLAANPLRFVRNDVLAAARRQI